MIPWLLNGAAKAVNEIVRARDERVVMKERMLV
jgi:hypothetical protein